MRNPKQATKKAKIRVIGFKDTYGYFPKLKSIADQEQRGVGFIIRRMLGERFAQIEEMKVEK
jgi:hypothetical protein